MAIIGRAIRFIIKMSSSVERIAFMAFIFIIINESTIKEVILFELVLLLEVKFFLLEGWDLLFNSYFITLILFLLQTAAFA